MPVFRAEDYWVPCRREASASVDAFPCSFAPAPRERKAPSDLRPARRRPLPADGVQRLLQVDRILVERPADHDPGELQLGQVPDVIQVGDATRGDDGHS